MLTKKQIRSKILARLRIQKEVTRDRKSRVIKEKLFREKYFKKAKTVMFYIAFGGEVKTEEMIKEAQKLGKIVTVPVCKNNGITIRPCILDDKSGLRNGSYGVCEPQLERLVHFKDIDLVIVPGIAFDKKGNRLGRGKGCYDRFLKTLPREIPSIGLAFSFQILPAVPAKIHDVRVNKIVFA
jgi:5-formyltetrahydrofolate cyclo-ligase